MRYGVNYVPAKHWWHSWLDWEPAAIAEDLAAVAALRMDHVRVQCAWPLFQPDPAWVSPTMLDRLAELMDLADEAGLDVCVTVLDGWLSGMYLRPFWQSETMNVFADQVAIDAARLLIREVSTAVGDHPRLLGLDIANEPNVLTQFVGNTATSSAQADSWTRLLLDDAQRQLPAHLHVVGFDHMPWLADSPFGRETIAATGSATAVHAWTLFTGAVDRYGPSGAGTVHLGEFMIELATAFHASPGRPVWLQEYGASRTWMPERMLADHAEEFTRAALSCTDLWGVTWWCSHDIDRRFAAFPELEYDLGLLTVRNEVKPVGARLRDLVERIGRDVRPPARTSAIVLRAGSTPGLGLLDEFVGLIDAGLRPALIREEWLDDPQVGLAARGLEPVAQV